MDLRYGLNPQQRPASAVSIGDAPFRVLNGTPSYINVLDAVNAWQLVDSAAVRLKRAVATSFKHVSPAGAAVAGTVDTVTADSYGIDAKAVSATCAAYIRARDADPRASYGDLVAVSEPVDGQLAELLCRVVSDGIIAPGFAPGAVSRLSAKKEGRYLVLEVDPHFRPPEVESRDIFGIRLTQPRSDVLPDIDVDDDTAAIDLLLGMITLRYTQSNSVAFLKDGMTVGIGAGQQSRIDCTALAGNKADAWWLRRHPWVRELPFHKKVRRQERITWQMRYIEGDMTGDERRRFTEALTSPARWFDTAEREQWLAQRDGLVFASDGALPFRDNIDRARRHGARLVVEPGGSSRSDEVAAACAEQGIELIRTGMRLFHH